MWVGILENKNVGYKSICMSGKVNNGLLNDMKMTCSKFMCTNQFFPMTFSRYRLLLFLFHSLEVHFINSYNNDQMFVGPLSIKTKHLSLVLSKHIKYRAVSICSFLSCSLNNVIPVY